MATNNVTTYEVSRRLIHDGKEYEVGSTIILTDEQEAALRHIEPPVIESQGAKESIRERKIQKEKGVEGQIS